MIKTVLPLAFIVANRFFGLFIIIPVLSVYADKLKHSNQFLVGLLIGVYALAQVCLQVPFGKLSDKIGRKKTISIGLFIFIIGSLICANSDDIYFMLFGRILQGSGAIGAVAIALVSDFVKEESRSKAMAIVGIMIGVSFTLAMIISPIMSAKYGLSSLFYLSAALSLVSILMLYTLVDKEKIIIYPKKKVSFSAILLNKDLAIMNFTNLMQKMLMSSAFLIIPILLANEFGFMRENLYKVYSIAALFGFVSMLLAGFLSDVKGKSKEILIVGIVLFIISYFIFFISLKLWFFVFGIVLFFIGFNIHEPIMQSTASKFALPSQKGETLGIFNSFGYFGSFFGGAFGGFIMKNYDIEVLAIIYIVLSLIWLFLLFKLSNPNSFKILYLKDLTLNVDAISQIKEVINCYKSEDFVAIKFNLNKISQDKLKEKIQGLK